MLTAAPASAVVQHDGLKDQRYADLDARKASVAPTGAQQDIVNALDAQARWNEFGTPRSLIRDGGFLATGIKAGNAEAAARAFVSDHLALFRLSSLDTLELENVAKLGDSGRAVNFRQRLGGRPATAGGTLTLALRQAQNGWSVAYASSSLTGDETLSGAAKISPAQAWARSARAVGVDASIAQLRTTGRKAGWTQLAAGGAARPGLVREVAFPTPKSGAVAAYETYVDRSASESYRQIVDATTGDVLFRESATDNLADNPRWNVFSAYPPLGNEQFPWNYPSTDTRNVWCWTAGADCDLAVANSASRLEWDKDAQHNQVTSTTIGNNAHAGENWQSFQGPQKTQYRPTSATRDYLYPWGNRWFEGQCNPSVFTPQGNDIDAAVTNLFVMHNRMHDWAYHLGFTEATWNAQDWNFGVNTSGQNDAIIGDAQAGGVTGGSPNWGGRDNANMTTLPDGKASFSNMYLWQPIAGSFYAPCVDGDFDMSVIGHEYGHMIENRMIGKGNRRSGFHAGAMGESTGDLVQMEYQSEWGFGEPELRTKVGPYVTSNHVHAIRNYDMAFPAAGGFPEPGDYPDINALNFSDVGYDFVGPQVHADGEIWSATNYGTRQLLIDRYGPGSAADNRACANGERSAQACSGNRRWIQIMFDSFLLMPIGPTFLDARDAQLGADMARFGGANQDLLWRSFARRGFGQNAATVGNNDTEPTPDFESPREDEATLTFQAVAKDEGSQPVPARIYVGHYEARVSPIADTIPTTAGTNLDDVARFVVPSGGAYEFVANAPGYGHVRFRVSGLQAGDRRTIRIAFPTNWASQSKGATAGGDGTGHASLIDDTEGTNWGSTGSAVEGKQVLVKLAGTRSIARLNVSGMLIPPQNRFTALRAFEVLACRAGTGSNPTCDPANSAGFRRVLLSEDDAFPSVPPRPVAPDLILRTWTTTPTMATHVLLRVLDNQCTGQAAFQGEQDEDPTNQTDCRTGSPPLPPRNTEVHAAELQVQSSAPTVEGAQAVD